MRSTIVAAVLLVLTATGTMGYAQEDAFKKAYDRLNQILESEGPDAAAKYLDEVTQGSDDRDLHGLRHLVAARLADSQEYRAALDQYDKILDFQLSTSDSLASQFGIYGTVQNIKRLADESGNRKRLASAVDRGFDGLVAALAKQATDASDPLAGHIKTLSPMSLLTVLKAHRLMDQDQAEEAQSLIDARLNLLERVRQSEHVTEKTELAHVRFLMATTSSHPENDSWREAHIQLLEKQVSGALEQFPKSHHLQAAYATTQYLMITQWEQEDPEITKQRIEYVSKVLGPIALRNRSVDSTIRKIRLHAKRLNRAPSANSLVGSPAPDWDIEAWVNAGDVNENSLEGKVILLDFWAMWCGPCIATFPHLRQWREEFHDEGFEIIGVTQYYNYQWDVTAQRAIRSTEKVAPEDERETLALFLEHHQLQHPTILTPTGSEMQQAFGVRGIPHAVLIDRQGVVQAVVTGAGKAQADQLHQKIKELVEQSAE